MKRLVHTSDAKFAQAQVNTRLNNLNVNANANTSADAKDGKCSISLRLPLRLCLYFERVSRATKTQANVMCKATRSMPPWLKLKPRWRPPPSHQMKKAWKASGIILYSTIRVILSIAKLQFFYNIRVSFLFRKISRPSTFWPSSCSVSLYSVIPSYQSKTKNQDGKRHQRFHFVRHVGMLKWASACVWVAYVNQL